MSIPKVPFSETQRLGFVKGVLNGMFGELYIYYHCGSGTLVDPLHLHLGGEMWTHWYIVVTLIPLTDRRACRSNHP